MEKEARGALEQRIPPSGQVRFSAWCNSSWQHHQFERAIVVTQSFTLLYRGFSIRGASATSDPLDKPSRCRLKVGDTADCKSALRPRRSGAKRRRAGRCACSFMCARNVTFCDGHVEAFDYRKLYLDATDSARGRWNSGNEPHHDLWRTP
ncbi:MAG: hypothetical protein FJ403_00510 [Verrucomicrobia bacterium]|nr:hypothetical protein [Verrucomicrobiota bacterium]